MKFTATLISTGLVIFRLRYQCIDESMTSMLSFHLQSSLHLTMSNYLRLLDLLFKFFSSWCLRVVPILFLRDMFRALSVPPSQPAPRTSHYSPMLHNALLALAMAFSDDPRICDLNSRQYFARKAKSYIEAECQSPNISVVHALSFLASFHSSLGDQTLGYMYFGMHLSQR
jgi:Fungal specific transcription factor domain